jgi:hypothetical protein
MSTSDAEAAHRARRRLVRATLVVYAVGLAGRAAAQEEAPPPAAQGADRIERAVSSRFYLSFDATPLGYVVSAIQDLTHVPVILAAGVDPRTPIDLRARCGRPDGLLLRDILNVIDQEAHLETRAWCDALYLAPAGKALPPPPPALSAGDDLRPALERLVTVCLEDAPVAAWFASYADSKADPAIRFADEATRRVCDAKAWIVCDRVPLARALSQLLGPRGLTWRVDAGGIVVVPAAGEPTTGVPRIARDRPIAAPDGIAPELQARLDASLTLDLDEQTLRGAALRLSFAADLRIDVAPGVPDDEVHASLAGKGLAVRTFLDLLTQGSGRTWSVVREDRILIR